MFDRNKNERIIELFLFDIYIAILKIKKVANEFNSAEQLKKDFRSWDSIIREFEIIGEACKHLLNNKILDEKYRKIVDFRNQISHAYFGIDADIVWQIIHQKLGDFEKIVLSLINQVEPNLKDELIDSFTEDNKYFDFIVEKLNKLKS